MLDGEAGVIGIFFFKRVQILGEDKIWCHSFRERKCVLEREREREFEMMKSLMFKERELVIEFFFMVFHGLAVD